MSATPTISERLPHGTDPEGSPDAGHDPGAGRRAFRPEGFAVAILAELVASAGLTRGAFYHHFESKDALAAAIAEGQAEHWREQLAKANNQMSVTGCPNLPRLGHGGKVVAY